MDQSRARELQEKLALEAAAMLSLAGSGAETAPYEQAVSLIGKAWRLRRKHQNSLLSLSRKRQSWAASKMGNQPSISGRNCS